MCEQKLVVMSLVLVILLYLIVKEHNHGISFFLKRKDLGFKL